MTGPRQRLLDAAETLMHARGYGAVGVAELCATAEVRKGSFYHFFDSKQSLALAMLDRSWAWARQALFDVSFTDPDLSAAESFHRYGDLLADHQAAVQRRCDTVAGCRFGNFAVERASLDPDLRSHVATVFAEMHRYMRDAIRRGVEAGDVTADLDPDAAATMLLAQMEGLMVLAKSEQDPDVLRGLGEVADRLLR